MSPANSHGSLPGHTAKESLSQFWSRFKCMMTSTQPKTKQKKYATGGHRKPAPSLDSPSPSSAAANACPSVVLTVELLHSVLGSRKADIFSQFDSLATSLRSEITSVKNELRKSVEIMQNKLDVLPWRSLNTTLQIIALALVSY